MQPPLQTEPGGTEYYLDDPEPAEPPEDKNVNSDSEDYEGGGEEEEEEEEEEDRVDRHRDRTHKKPLVGKLVKGNYNVIGWFVGRVEYYNKRLKQYHINFGEGQEGDYFQKEELGKPDLYLVDEHSEVGPCDVEREKSK